MLTADLLEAFLASLTRAGFPTVERLYPGLTDEQMDEITAPLGMTLPTEARVWWSRQNGGDKALIASYRYCAPLEEMVAQAQQSRQLQREVSEEVGNTTWNDRLLPLTLDPDTIFACDCSVAPGAPTPISVWIPKDAEDLREPILPSFGSLVEIWITAIEEGLYQYLPDKGYAVMTAYPEPGRWPYGCP